MLDYPLDLLARVLDARLRGESKATVRRVSTDSRTVEAGDLFIALAGEKSDGHAYLKDAFARGAAAALVDAKKVPAGAKTAGPLLEVPDPLLGLGALAAWHRNRYPVRIAAVTGSVGKTTTKDFLYSILSQQWTTLKSPASFNAEVGLPLTLLQLGPQHQAAVVEMAMRGPGQIRYLARLARPEVAVITNIGLSHIEMLGSQQGIAEAKAELLDFLPVGGTAVLNGDDPQSAFLCSRVPPGAESCLFGLDRPEREAVTGTYLGPGRAESREAESALGARFALRASRGSKVQRIWIPLLGRHNVRNALAAAAAGQVLGVSWPRIIRGLENAETSAMRMTVHRLRDGGLILDDAYNASTPEAMEAALEVLHEMPGLRKIAVLGNMLELGPEAEKAHRQIGKAAAQSAPSLLITVGDHAALIAESAAEAGLDGDAVIRCATNDDAVREVAAHRRAGDVILVKGSRGMGMEAVVQGLQEPGGA